MTGEPSEDREAASTAGAAEGPTRSSKRLEIAYQEARAVLEAQQATAADIDQKTTRTVRLTAVIVGLVLSAAQLEAMDFDPPAATIAVGVLIVSLIVGVINYSASDPIAGLNPQYLSRLVANDFPETSWETHLLSEAGSWISDNEAEIARSGDVLLVQRVLLALGIIETSMADDSSEREPGSETGQRLRKGPAWLSNFLNFGRTRKKSE